MIYDNHRANILVLILFKTFSCSSKFLLNCYICFGSMLTRTIASSLKTVHVIRVEETGAERVNCRRMLSLSA